MEYLTVNYQKYPSGHLLTFLHKQVPIFQHFLEPDLLFLLHIRTFIKELIKEKTIELIDALKATCLTYGMGNDGNEYKIITQVFLYKFLNDKFGYEEKK